MSRQSYSVWCKMVLKQQKQRDQHYLVKREDLNRLFYVASCQCEDLKVCTCDRNIKVPIREQEFLIDQRTIRQMTIGSVDRQVTKMIKRRKVRGYRLHDRQEQERIRSSESSLLSSMLHSSSSKCDLHLEQSVKPWQPVRQCRFQQQALNPFVMVILCQRLMLKTRVVITSTYMES